jgi:hypothetical protein
MKRNVLFFLFLSFYMNSSKIILVNYDETSDSITFHDKIYYPSLFSSNNQPSFKSVSLKEEKQHSQEEISNAEFWTFLFISFCKINV